MGYLIVVGGATAVIALTWNGWTAAAFAGAAIGLPAVDHHWYRVGRILARRAHGRRYEEHVPLGRVLASLPVPPHSAFPEGVRVAPSQTLYVLRPGSARITPRTKPAHRRTTLAQGSEQPDGEQSPAHKAA